MSDPCMQAPTIAKMDGKLDKVLDALQVLAAQKVQIDNLIDNQDEHHAWLKGHERRIQTLEQTPGKLAGKTLGVLIGIAGTVVAGVIIYGLTQT